MKISELKLEMNQSPDVVSLYRNYLDSKGQPNSYRVSVLLNFLHKLLVNPINFEALDVEETHLLLSQCKKFDQILSSYKEADMRFSFSVSDPQLAFRCQIMGLLKNCELLLEGRLKKLKLAGVGTHQIFKILPAISYGFFMSALIALNSYKASVSSDMDVSASLSAVSAAPLYFDTPTRFANPTGYANKLFILSILGVTAVREGIKYISHVASSAERQLAGNIAMLMAQRENILSLLPRHSHVDEKSVSSTELRL